MRALFVAALAASIGVSFAARADIIPTFVSVTPTTGGNYVWKYSVALTNDQAITPALAAGASTPIGGTIFDFGPVIGSPTLSGAAAGSFTASVSNTSTATYLQNPSDNAGLSNVNYTYNGTGSYDATGSGASGIPLFDVSATSPYGGTHQTVYDGGAFHSGAQTGNIGFTSAPVPEPSTLAVLGVAFAGLLGVGYRRAKSA